MRGLRDSDGESAGGEEDGETTVSYSEREAVRCRASGRRLKQRLKPETADSEQVRRLEQRVSKLESLLETVTDNHGIAVTRESGEWFAHDPETGCSGNGSTRAEAIAQLAEAIAHESGEIAFTEEFADDVEAGQRQIESGDTTSADDVRSRLGIDD